MLLRVIGCEGERHIGGLGRAVLNVLPGPAMVGAGVSAGSGKVGLAHADVTYNTAHTIV